MSSKSEFYGNVGQAVFGNLNEAARMNNVVTLHIGEQEKEIELITSYQRSRIKVLVNELAFLTGDDDLSIYKVLITDYGLQRFRELPRNKYQEVKTTLEDGIREAKVSSLPAADATAPAHEKLPSSIKQALRPCLTCAEKAESFKRLQNTSRLQLLALAICLIFIGWLLYKVPMMPENKENIFEDKCYISGKIFSVGYVIVSVDGVMFECVLANGKKPTMWIEKNYKH